MCVYLWCVDSVRGVRQISWCVTGAIKVVALDTAHEQHNDSWLVLISLHLALFWARPAKLYCWTQAKGQLGEKESVTATATRRKTETKKTERRSRNLV